MKKKFPEILLISSFITAFLLWNPGIAVTLFRNLGDILNIGHVLRLERSHAATGDIILLWDGPTIPSGWTCVSCASGDPFFGVFPRGSSTYANASSGADLVSHTAVFISHTQGTGVNTQSGTDEPDAGHTHGVTNVNLGLADIRPPFKNLKFIRAATT